MTKLLAIETSCDDTSIAIINENKELLSHKVQSQYKDHEEFYGIVPELASRKHLENINFILIESLKEASLSIYDIDGVAVTTNPGLKGSLLIGEMVAKTIAFILGLELVRVNHLRAHIWANFVKLGESSYPNLFPEFPAIVLLVSGGHTELYLMESLSNIYTLGRTRDDAAGEAYDKVAKILNLGYPGGPAIDALYGGVGQRVVLPRPILRGSYDFSFSGLKTAVLNKKGNIPNEILAASFQDAVAETLIYKMKKSISEFNAKSIVLSGGVAANSLLRKKTEELALTSNITMHCPPLWLCTDNAAMVGALAIDSLGYKLESEGPIVDYMGFRG